MHHLLTPCCKCKNCCYWCNSSTRLHDSDDSFILSTNTSDAGSISIMCIIHCLVIVIDVAMIVALASWKWDTGCKTNKQIHYVFGSVYNFILHIFSLIQHILVIVPNICLLFLFTFYIIDTLSDCGRTVTEKRNTRIKFLQCNDI